ncbi:MAG TPA: UvrD-helicase domain-containing protein [bacterium]|nr:UvrD-helicase domain-containing protein [bacterium]HOL49081.1 UvrD-helicase domain-containing protein [bacterium]HPO52422.1 UvrD-helicase domain-containing protein [bacterium]
MKNNQETLNFSVRMIHASAGTGKTHRLTREFIALVKKDDFIRNIKRIVAITFSEKAACEMKSRIIHAIFNEILTGIKDEKTRIEYENQLFLLRISTIHSFCKNLLTRFSFLFQIDPNFTVAEPEKIMIFFNQAISKFLENTHFDNPVISRVKPMKMKQFLDRFGYLNKNHPQVFLGKPIDDNETTGPVFECFLIVNNFFQEIKKQQSVMDFNDLEIYTYLLLKEHPESLNVLNDFDEAVDFIFVDEFQDTSLLQWKIIREFSSEWVSGIGAKADTGKSYGLFFVGDRKQSIYHFRGAENTVFDDARAFYGQYVSSEYLTTSYRSFPSVIEFVNRVFEGYPGFPEQEKLRVHSDFANRKEGFVEVKLFEKNTSIFEAKETEFNWIARRILSLIDSQFTVYDKNTKAFRPISFKDIAILMRKRTHLKILEQQLRSYSIPFVNVGGIGFYQEPEIKFLVYLLCALADGSDLLALKNLQQSVFKINLSQIEQWRTLLKSDFAASVLDRIIAETGMFSVAGTQGCANIEKFLMLVHEMRDIPFFQMVQNFRGILSKEEEPKADVFSEFQDAVRVLTVHGSKGLEFPVVFLSGLEQGIPNKSKITLMHKRNDTPDSDYVFSFRSSGEKGDFYDDYVRRLEEEERRILYVALTRARQSLVITGVKRRSTWFEMLEKFEIDYPATDPMQREFVVRQQEQQSVSQIPVIRRRPVSPVSFSSQKEQFESQKEKTGTIIHKIICEISNGFVNARHDEMTKRARFLAEKINVNIDYKDLEIHLQNLLKPEILDVISPKPDSYSELPFLVEIDGMYVQGVIDRVVYSNGIWKIYDYKTRHTLAITDDDRKQLKIYREGISHIFGTRNVQAFLIFTFCGIIKELE